MSDKTNDWDISESCVYTITDWYDGARRGVADFRGKPHYYECLQEYDYKGRATPYQLTPIDEESFRLELEDWNIWLRYEEALKAGTATDETHPAIPEDQVRHEEITRALLEKRNQLDVNAAVVTGAFNYGVNTTVIWTIISGKD